MKLISSILQARNCQVTLAQDGASAFTALQSIPFDLILFDIELPGTIFTSMDVLSLLLMYLMHLKVIVFIKKHGLWRKL